MKLGDLWRVSTARLLPVYGALFAVWSVLLIGVIQWDTQNYLSSVVDEILSQRAQYLTRIDRARLPAAMAQTGALDLRGVMLYGLFDQNGNYVTGNILAAPPGIVPDGEVRLIRDGVRRFGGAEPVRARGLARTLDTGETLILARSTSVIEQVNTIIYRSLLWGLSLTIIPGLIGGFWLARRPLRRVRAIEAAVQPIMLGDLRQRLPISSRRDELDLLAGIVNTMLVELERLMGEVKGVCDSIAHDLRTPLTRVRSQLHRLQRDVGEDDPRLPLIVEAIEDVDSLLERFRALLRISELEDMHRRAGFRVVDLLDTISNVREIYAPLAEDKQIVFTSHADAELPSVHGDPNLLLEALSNIVDNAIKFSPPGGRVQMRVALEPQGPRVDVLDDGPGIGVAERGAVMQRFYRGSSSNQGISGLGLGLSIVAAIVKLHGFKLEITESETGGTRVSLHCWRDLGSDA